MSLFPAYAAVETTGKVFKDFTEKTESEDQKWQTNSSFNKDICSINNASTHSNTSKVSKNNSRDVEANFTQKLKKKKSVSHKEKYSSYYHSEHDISLQEKLQKDDRFYMDKRCEKGNLSVPTLSRPAVPKYRIDSSLTLGANKLPFQSHKKKKKLSKCRYFRISQRDHDGSGSHGVPNSSRDDVETGSYVLHPNFSQTVGEFNRRLMEEPNNISLWMEYIQFQDSVNLFDVSYSRSQNAQRVTAEKKLAILDKAIQLNPLSDTLLKERFKIVENIFTHEQLAEDASRHLDKDPSRLVLWRSLINSTRNNMAQCTVPNVLQIFTRAILRLHQLRRGASRDLIQKLEECILVLVLDYGLFLQQAGLWEQLWTLLKLYLTFNLSLSEPNNFAVDITIPEKQLFDEEDAVIKSGLPLPTLWVRVEHLRSSAHFLPVESSDDPQRIVFTDDMSGLLQPITSTNLNLLLVIATLVLLKVPLLPTRHSTLQMLGLLDIPSSINNIETVLAAVYPVGPMLDMHYEYLSEAVNLSIEPQFVRGKFGSTEFLTWVISVMKTCANHLQNQESVIVHCWVLRFFRWLLRLDRTKLTTLPGFITKQSKAYAKELLKKPQYRDCLQLYIECALVERDLGNLAGACRILETAAKLRYNVIDTERPVLVAVYHNLIDTMLQDADFDRNKAISALVSLVEMQPLNLEQRSDADIKKSLTKSNHIVTEIVTQTAFQSLEYPSLSDWFSPHLCVEWTACHAWFLYLTQSVWAGTAFIEEVMGWLKYSSNPIIYIWREQLCEILVSMLHYHVRRQVSGYSVLRDTLQRAVKEFPNNLHILNTIATLETSSECGTLWWKLVTSIPVDSTLARLVLIFIARAKLKCENEFNHSSTNRLHNLLKESTLNPITKKCPLIWRLYLQFVANKEDKTTLKNTFYKALEECPWVKCLYFEAAQFLPEDLPEIQDLLIEKELRLHTTPEELEVLRVEERPDVN